MRSATELINRALRSVAEPTQKGSPIYLALSGGVDSSVSALILREAGWCVNPILMRCWDDQQDEGSNNCFDTELRAAERTVATLKVEPLKVFDFVKEYWTDVFENVFLRGIKSGFIPNADLACNRWVKFGAFPERVTELGGHNARMATGHYAKVRHTPEGVRLYAARDIQKDQSYFLASVQGDSLKRVTLPVGDLLKSEVISIASAVNLPSATAKSSRGICFVGKRSMAEFLAQYVVMEPGGKFVSLTSGEVLGEVKNGHAFTVGQRAKIGGLAQAMFVVRKQGKDIIVAPQGHKSLRCQSVWCDRADWVRAEPWSLAAGRETKLSFKGCSTMAMQEASVRRKDGGWVVSFEKEGKRIARGQAIVLYDGDECLGALWPRHVYEKDGHTEFIVDSSRDSVGLPVTR
ncbi:tRNA-specific 2-thiouridylase MnmA [Gracilariopsis chorda]|uniref:tRNA-5-taurinomethyluridine 2-sulfurtransferase n=1 Tax=Gracilariopsis chorda TaxID=448386 RepID=A0A2V3IW79_9FLOR|nr:tRNA-specific 2-thiouridylase MnmA [Gracilariopsis chorda]|eukprot:PXF46345.1 tRNA-specific 2-thiouridylase MnmA [Gracilariopsis chorda]